MRKLLPIVAAVVLVGLLGLAWHWQRTLAGGLCPRTLARDRAHGLALAHAHIGARGGELVAILGTGSMAPFIPAAAPARDPWRTIVAYAVTHPGATFADVSAGLPCLYFAEWAGGPVLHSAAQRTAYGWIMTGLANARFENWEPMTVHTFRGIAAHVYTWPPS